MIRVHILSERLVNQNTRAFLAPLIWNQQRIKTRGISIHFYFEQTPEIAECDVLAINGKYWNGPWEKRQQEAIVWLSQMREKVRRIVFFDRSSTAGHILMDVMPLVDAYCKTALYKNRKCYLRPLYGSRLFTDHYHRTLDLIDKTPTFSAFAPDLKSLEKLHNSWNTGFANYSLLGPRLGTLYNQIPWRRLLAPPRKFYPPSKHRNIEISCRIGLSYKYATLAYQRKKIAELLASYRRTDRIAKLEYFRELKNSKIVASPFGTSEINYRDFETFICGAVLLKPDMSHIDTYPNLYKTGQTYVAHSWDFDDLESTVDEVLSNYQDHIEIAFAGQDLYRWHVANEEGQEAFVDQFNSIIRTLPGTHNPERPSAKL